MLAQRNKKRAFQFATLDGSFNILQNCSISQFVTVRSSKEFRGAGIALSVRWKHDDLFELTEWWRCLPHNAFFLARAVPKFVYDISHTSLFNTFNQRGTRLNHATHKKRN
jgi:hypothetical protein